MSDLFGKAKFSGSNRNYYKLKDGTNGPYRILPPMGDLAEDGIWHVYYSIHYGYRNSKNEMRTFQSPLVKNRKTKMIDVPDAALDRINQLKAKLDAAKEAGDTALVAKITELVGGKKSRYNMDSHHYLNVIDTQGNIGILKLRYKAKQALDIKIKELRDAGIDPLSPESGRFFTFLRSGSGLETVFAVSVYKKKFTVEGHGEVEQDVVHVITDDIKRRCIVKKADGTLEYREAARLDTLFRRPTAEQVERIVKEGPTAVDEILDAKTSDDVAPDTGDDEDAPTPTQTAPTPAPVQTAPAVAAVTQVTTPVTTPVQATVAPAPVAAPVATPTPIAPSAPLTTSQGLTEMSEADFLKSLDL
jgi:hypothetical protein